LFAEHLHLFAIVMADDRETTMLKSANKAATSAIFSSLVLALSAGALHAFEQPKFDKRIEEAAKEIIAKKIGDIRGSVEADVWVAEFGVDTMMTGPVVDQEAFVRPDVQLAGLTQSLPSLTVPVSARPVRKISSFIFF
jgi:hypothetical protein